MQRDPGLLLSRTQVTPARALVPPLGEIEENIQEALDCLDYAEEKLLELEAAPGKLAGVRRLQGTFVRLYELSWLLRFRVAFPIVQRARAFLSYARQESIGLTRDDVSRLFALCDNLTELFRWLQEEHEGLYQQGSEWWSLAETLRDPPSGLEADHHQSLEWITSRLTEVERLQMSHVEGRAHNKGSSFGRIDKHHLLPHPAGLTSELPSARDIGVIDAEDAFAEDESASSDSQELRSLKRIVSALGSQLQTLQEQLSQQSLARDIKPTLSQALAFHTALNQRVAALSDEPGPSSSLFGLVVGEGEQFFCLPTSVVKHIFPVSELFPPDWRHDEKMTLWRDGEAILVRSLQAFLEQPGSSADGAFEQFAPQDAFRRQGTRLQPTPSTGPFVLLIETPAGAAACWVDQIVREMMIELLSAGGGESAWEDTQLLKGKGQLPDGKPVWLIDAEVIVASREAAAARKWPTPLEQL